MNIFMPLVFLFSLSVSFVLPKPRSVNKKISDDPPTCGYESCPTGKPGFLNVHMVSHTHNDVGWLKTVDQYYYGGKNDIQIAGVQYILDSVIDALLADESRRFIYVETAFFWRWWLQQDDLMHHTVHRLVNEGRLEFISGAWSMNDEAVCHYASIIENFAWGLRKLNDTFKECGRPKIGWQIDPFGHSKEQASIFSQLGFDGLFLGRIDYQDIDKRRLTKTMEMIWESSSTLGDKADIFTGILPNVYWPPSTFCFDLLCGDPPIMDDPRLEDYNVDERVATFMKIVQDQAKQYATDNLVITMGNDFNYQQAHVWFKNLDKLMKYVNAQQNNGSKINLFYSTPSCYLNALNKAGKTWPTKNDDFFPYASGNHTYWTGYFTSRPTLKRMEREASSFLQVCKQIDALAQLGPLDQNDISILREAVGVAQHHDAVTGTERQHVADDYARMLHRGIVECQEAVKDGINKLSNVSKPVDYKFCNLLNISQCEYTENGREVAIVIWNPLGRTVNRHVRLPVADGTYEVTGPGSAQVPFQISPLPKSTLNFPGRTSNATHEIVFGVKLPPIGYAAYGLKRVSGPSRSNSASRSQVLVRSTRSFPDVPFGDEEFVIKNDYISLTFDQATGLLKSLTNLESQETIALNQTFGFYEGSVGNNTKEEWRATGAYISRPNCTMKGHKNQKNLGEECFRMLLGNGSYEIVKGPVVQEVRQYINSWVSQVIRLSATSRHVDFEWQVGPIPVEDGIGKEIVSRFDTDLKSGDKFFTDSNGRQNMERKRNFRPTFDLNLTEPISSNYYPVVTHMFMQDESKGTQLTVLTDRAQGGSSLKEGQLELMVHRRLLVDDWLGVSEPLNETGLGEGLVARGRHQLIFTKAAKAPRRHRLLTHNHFSHPVLLFAPVSGRRLRDVLGDTATSFTTATESLPLNLHLLSLEQWKGSSMVIRLEHIFEKDEDPVLSKPASVDLQSIIANLKITSVREMTIDANVPADSIQRLKWQKAGNQAKAEIETAEMRSSSVMDSTVVTLNPMEIRTYQIEVEGVSA